MKKNALIKLASLIKAKTRTEQYAYQAVLGEMDSHFAQAANAQTRAMNARGAEEGPASAMVLLRQERYLNHHLALSLQHRTKAERLEPAAASARTRLEKTLQKEIVTSYLLEQAAEEERRRDNENEEQQRALKTALDASGKRKI